MSANFTYARLDLAKYIKWFKWPKYLIDAASILIHNEVQFTKEDGVPFGLAQIRVSGPALGAPEGIFFARLASAVML